MDVWERESGLGLPFIAADGEVRGRSRRPAGGEWSPLKATVF
jgi:hypothetical protein